MKLHLEIRNDIPVAIALECVKQVIEQGKISAGGKSYCYVTVFDTSEGEVWVGVKPYRKYDCFLIYKNNKI